MAPRQNGASSIKMNLSPSEAGKKDEAPKDPKAKVCCFTPHLNTSDGLYSIRHCM